MRMWQVRACVRALLADPSTLTAQELGSGGHTATEHLLFVILDALNVANWQRTGKRSNRPRPTSPLRRDHNRSTYGTTDREPAEVIDLLARIAPSEEVTPDGQ